jgi:transposase
VGAEGGRSGEVRFLGDVENSPLPIKRLADRYERLHVCFRAGGIRALWPGQGARPRLYGGRAGADPERSGECIKTNRRDAVMLARLHRAGELTGVWAPDPAHEAVRDLMAREASARGTARYTSKTWALIGPSKAEWGDDSFQPQSGHEGCRFQGP